MDDLKGSLQTSFEAVAGDGGNNDLSASFSLHDALMERAAAQIPEEWKENPGGYRRGFAEQGKAYMQAQQDMHWQEGKVFTEADQSRMIEGLPADLDRLNVETYYLNREMTPETQERRHVINNTGSELSVAAQYEEMGGPDAFADPEQIKNQTEGILERAGANGRKYGFSPEQAYEDMTGKPLPEGMAAELERNITEPEAPEISNAPGLVSPAM